MITRRWFIGLLGGTAIVPILPKFAEADHRATTQRIAANEVWCNQLQANSIAIAKLNPESPKIGDTWWDMEEDTLYRYTGTEWKNIGEHNGIVTA